MLPVFNALSKNLAHNSPQIEIYIRKGSHYEEVFGLYHDAFGICHGAAAVGRSVPKTQTSLRVEVVPDYELSHGKLRCPSSELLSASSQHDQYWHCDRCRSSDRRTTWRTPRRWPRTAWRSRSRCSIHLQAKSETSPLLNSATSFTHCGAE
jgi:hypothetical protein